MAVGLLLALNRKFVIADSKVHHANFLQDGLLGFDLNEKTVGIVGTGNIGAVMAKIMRGFGCTLLANDIDPDLDLVMHYGMSYVRLEEICSRSDVISLHVPLTQETHNMIDDTLFKRVKKEVVLINTARGAVVDTNALLNALEKGIIGAYGTDVYEKERGTFFQNHSKDGIKDVQLKKLISFPNVLLTPHQGFITKEALTKITETTFYNLDCWSEGITNKNELGHGLVRS
ncbi:MAG TPA: NAD(P)-dependent oxidoreductase [Pricia sp.]|nr:NAD(P)-dependent oxidoreductase [Pricia sp.]